MRNTLKIITTISFLSFFLMSCRPDYFYPDCFYHMQIRVTNNTESTLHLEQHKISGSDIHRILYVDIKSDSTGGFRSDSYYGSKSDDNPPEYWVLENLQSIGIYRDVNGSQQELPKEYIDHPSAFEITKEYLLSTSCNVIYAITITEDMFSEL